MKRLISACVLGLAFAAVPAIGHAQATKVSNANSDVWDGWDGSFGWWNPDISGVRIAHTANRLVVTAEFHRLTRPAYDVLEIRINTDGDACLLYTSPSPRDRQKSRMP